MTANIESVFYVRQTPWHGLGNRVEHTLSSEEALQVAELDWEVIQKSTQTEDYAEIAGYKANIRATADRLLGVVSNRHKIVQNHKSFALADELLGEGVASKPPEAYRTEETCRLLAPLPENYIIARSRQFLFGIPQQS